MDAALASGASCDGLYIDRDSVSRSEMVQLVQRAQRAGTRVFTLAAGVLEKVTDATTPQPVLAVVHFSTLELESIELNSLVLVLENIRDPGNLGTVIRSADAAGVSAIVLSGECVDPFNPKTLRATAGSIFHVPLVLAPLADTLSFLHVRGVRSFATVLSEATSYLDCDVSAGCAVVIGNESAGLSEAAAALCDERMTIEMVGRAESLNAGVAASLIAFEALRQRRGTTRV